MKVRETHVEGWVIALTLMMGALARIILLSESSAFHKAAQIALIVLLVSFIQLNSQTMRRAS